MRNILDFKTVAGVVNSDFCMGCGICEVVCPVDAIKLEYDKSRFHYTAKVNDAVCVKCGKCLEVCSGWKVDHAKLNLRKFGKIPENPYLGNYQQVLSVYSNDNEIRSFGASGGFVTQLLLNLLEDSVIDAALIVKPGEESPLEPEVILARNKEDLLSGQGSCYLNASICSGLKEVIEKKLKVAVVAVPCAINSIVKSWELLPELKEQIVFTIGLFCNGVYTGKALKDFCESKGIEFGEVKKVNFRWGNWPGKMRLIMKNGKEFLGKRDHNFAVNYMNRCYYCYDFLADKADVSVGDNWAETDKKGKNIIIVRNPDIMDYFSNITVEKFRISDLFQTHRLYHSRRRYSKAQRIVSALIGKKYPLILPDKNIKLRSWNFLVSIMDLKRQFMGRINSGFLRKKYIEIRSMIHAQMIYSKPVPAKLNQDENDSMSVLITEGDLLGNKGAVAMTLCIINDLRKANPNINITITSKIIKKNIHTEDNVKILYINDLSYELAVIRAGIWWIFNKAGINFKSLLNHNIIKSYQQVDLVISATGISFIDDFGYRMIYHYARYVLLPLMLGKKLVKFTQSFGPINSWYNRLMTNSLLPLAEIVMARGRHSVENLRKAGISENVRAFPDIAVTLEPDNSKKVEEEKLKGKYIGISPNIVCKRLAGDDYLKSMKELVKHIIEKHPDMGIIFIPHTISAGNLGKNDDLSLCRELAGLCGSIDHKIADTLDMSSAELKALIGSCEFFIGSRYHSLVASVSMAVPCFAIGWHWKYNELMEWYGIDDNIINIWELDKCDITSIFDDLYETKASREEYFKSKNNEVKKLAKAATDHIIEELKK